MQVRRLNLKVGIGRSLRGETNASGTAIPRKRESGARSATELYREDDRAEPSTDDAAHRSVPGDGSIAEKVYRRRRFASVYTVLGINGTENRVKYVRFATLLSSGNVLQGISLAPQRSQFT